MENAKKMLGKSVEKWKRNCEKNETLVEKKKRNLILIIDFDVEKSRQKKLNSILKCDLICIVEKSINIEDYNFE